jgi:two-component system cell cycle response regulator DivK
MAKILLVEDNEMNRDMLSRRLARRGHDVTMALDGPAGIAAATANRPDLILMDISLPGMDGWEATKVLRSQAETASVPIIALTAHAMETDRQRSLEVGCNDFDTKPVDLARLLIKIDALLTTEA